MDFLSIDTHVGAKLQKKRIDLKLSQRDLSELCNISLRQLQKYEKGVNRIGASKLYMFANILKVEISYFFEGYVEDNNNDNKLNYSNNGYSNDDINIINELVPVFLLLPLQTKKNILKLVKDITAKTSQLEENKVITEEA